MGVDYVIDLPCMPKSALGTRRIVELLKGRSRADHVEQLLRARGDQRPAAELVFETVTLGPAGPQEATVSVQQLRDQARRLDEQASLCDHCVARTHPRPFACVGYVGYPLAASTERWLLSLLPDSLETLAGQALVRAFRDFGWDGHYAEGLRTRGQTFFEARETQYRYWNDFTLSSDQVFDILFGLGSLQPAHTQMLALFFGIIPHDISPFAFGRLSEDRAGLADMALRRMSPSTQDPPGIGELRTFLRAAALAAALGRSLLIEG